MQQIHQYANCATCAFNAGSWILEDWVNFCFYYCPLVFGDIVHSSTPKMGAALDYFRGSMLFYMRGAAMIGNNKEEFKALQVTNTSVTTKCGGDY